MNININYETKDLYLAAYLIATGHMLKNHTKCDGETYFIFEDNGEIQNEVNKFISRKALVEPVAFSQAMKSLKSVIYAIKDGNGNMNNATRRK